MTIGPKAFLRGSPYWGGLLLSLVEYGLPLDFFGFPGHGPSGRRPFCGGVRRGGSPPGKIPTISLPGCTIIEDLRIVSAL